VSPDLAFLNTSGAGLEMMLRLTWPAAHNGGVNWNSAAAWNLVNAGTLFTLPGTSLWTVRVDEAVIGTLFEDPSGLSGGGNATLTSAPISGEHDPFGEAMIVDLAFSLTPGTSAEVNGSMLLTPCLSCAGDADCDGIVDISDVLALLAAWGTDDPLFDLAPEGGDGQVDVVDLLALLASWGPCP
jgi:hypothetical protein